MSEKQIPMVENKLPISQTQLQITNLDDRQSSRSNSNETSIQDIQQKEPSQEIKSENYKKGEEIFVELELNTNVDKENVARIAHNSLQIQDETPKRISNNYFEADFVKEKDGGTFNNRHQVSFRNKTNGIVKSLKSLSPKVLFQSASKGLTRKAFVSQSFRNLGQFDESPINQHQIYGSQRNFQEIKKRSSLQLDQFDFSKSHQNVLSNVFDLSNIEGERFKQGDSVHISNHDSSQQKCHTSTAEESNIIKKAVFGDFISSFQKVYRPEENHLVSFTEQKNEDARDNQKKIMTDGVIIPQISKVQEGGERKLERKRSFHFIKKTPFSEKEIEEEIKSCEEIRTKDPSLDSESKGGKEEEEEKESSFENKQELNPDFINSKKIIEDLRNKIEYKIQSINSLARALKSKLALRNLWTFCYYIPICLAFIILSMRHAFFFCNTNIFIHLCLYTLLSFRNYFQVSKFYSNCYIHLIVLEKYQKCPLFYNVLFQTICELQAEYKKQYGIENRQILSQDNAENKSKIQLINSNQISSNNEDEKLNGGNQAKDDEFIQEERLNIEKLKTVEQKKEIEEIEIKSIGDVPDEEQICQIKQQSQISERKNEANNIQSFEEMTVSQSKWQSMLKKSDQNFAEIVSQKVINIDNEDNKEENRQQDYYIDCLLQISLSGLLEQENLKNQLLNSPPLSSHYLENVRNGFLQSTETTNHIIEELEKIMFTISSHEIDRHIESKIKYPKSPNFARFNRVWRFCEDSYLVAYNILLFTFTYCEQEEKPIVIVFGFLYSIVLWVQIFIITFSFAFMLLALIFYLLFLVLSYKKAPTVPTIQFKMAKQLLTNNGKTPQYINELNCIICFEDFKDKDQVFVSPCCQKCYHQSCMNLWIRKNQNCPLCRSPFKIT